MPHNIPCGENMEETVNVDKQGRVVLPSRMREALGIKSGGEATIRLTGNQIIIEAASVETKARVAEWGRMARSLKAEAISEGGEESHKWVSREYARKKLGLS